MSEGQTTAHVMMIRPVHFAGNPETLASNSFQTPDAGAGTHATACAEFDVLVRTLRAAGVTIHVFDDTPDPHTPDAVFPNNWVSFHADGTVVLYPMLAANRRFERRLGLIEQLSLDAGFRITRTVDLTHREREGRFLEGTGSLVLDRTHHIAYACLSPRTDIDVLAEFAQQLDYEIAAFEAHDANGAAIYHTNVMMSVGTRFVAICTDSIEASRRAPILRLLRSSGREVVELSLAQMHAFAGNMLELRAANGAAVLAMSDAAHQSLDAWQRAVLEAVTTVVAVPIPTIERVGGGSVRCMLAEVHLPRKQ